MVCAGLAAACLAVALGHPERVVVLLAVFAAARISIGWAPLDAHPSAHLVLALAAFVAAPWAATALKSSDHGEPVLGRVLAAFALATAIALRSRLRPWLGLVERGFYAALLAWLVLVAVRLL